MDKKAYFVRRAILADLEKLVSFTVVEAKEAEGIDLSPKNVRRSVLAALENDALGKYWVLAREKDEIIGNVSVVREWSNWKGGYYWWIQSLFIQPEFRGLGLMQMLIDTVKEEARNEEALELRLCVHSANKRALKAYRKSGFSESDYRIMRMSV
ncbi:MAG: GNAT family N-acetyltransferase [Candidatus Aminicenantes bacterium]|nr:GNAT family N-acetyltransferase [Candidatus Aminicenantes bacterium]